MFQYDSDEDESELLFLDEVELNKYKECEKESISETRDKTSTNFESLSFVPSEKNLSKPSFLTSNGSTSFLQKHTNDSNCDFSVLEGLPDNLSEAEGEDSFEKVESPALSSLKETSSSELLADDAGDIEKFKGISILELIGFISEVHEQILTIETNLIMSRYLIQESQKSRTTGFHDKRNLTYVTSTMNQLVTTTRNLQYSLEKINKIAKKNNNDEEYELEPSHESEVNDNERLSAKLWKSRIQNGQYTWIVQTLFHHDKNSSEKLSVKQFINVMKKTSDELEYVISVMDISRKKLLRNRYWEATENLGYSNSESMKHFDRVVNLLNMSILRLLDNIDKLVDVTLGTKRKNDISKLFTPTNCAVTASAILICFFSFRYIYKN